MKKLFPLIVLGGLFALPAHAQYFPPPIAAPDPGLANQMHLLTGDICTVEVGGQGGAAYYQCMADYFEILIYGHLGIEELRDSTIGYAVLCYAGAMPGYDCGELMTIAYQWDICLDDMVRNLNLYI